MKNRKALLAELPKVDKILDDERLHQFIDNTPRELIVESVRETVAEERRKILGQDIEGYSLDLEDFIADVLRRIQEKKKHSLIKAVNATGVVLHTNLGRAVLSDSACRNISEIAGGYSTLEYSLECGGRGSRYSHIDSLICKITGAEAAIAVNNNAAATFLCLTAVADGREVVVSRGELVEIGGSFRIPEIMECSGAKLVEVGTTNKTRVSDYEAALTEETAAIMKVHTSNYRILGFTEEATLNELISLGREKGIPVIYDMGSGLMADLSSCGINEPTVKESLKTGIDAVLFSGDKLMGGPQAGIIAGKKEIIEKMKKHPLARAFRSDKLTLAALEATLREYIDTENVMKRIPTLKMITMGIDEMKSKGMLLKKRIEPLKHFQPEIVAVTEQVGGGCAPTVEIDGIAVKIKTDMPAEKLERMLRMNAVPIIVRITGDEIYFDMRTVEESDVDIIVDAMYMIEKSI